MEGSGVGLRTDAGDCIMAAAGWAAPAWALGASQQEPQREEAVESAPQPGWRKW